MATNVLSIPEDFYISVQDYIINEFRENYPAGLIPVENLDANPYIHRIPYFDDLDVSKGVLDWTSEQKRADNILSYLDVPIFGRQMKLAFTNRDLRRTGLDIIDAKMQAIIEKFLDEVDECLWHGNIEGKVTLNTGLLTQATNVALTTPADTSAKLLANLQLMITSIPVKYRSKNVIVLMMNWSMYDKISTALIGTDTATTVLQVFKAAYPDVVIVKNSSAVLAAADVEATHARMFSFPQNINVIRNVKAKEVSPIGPAIVTLTGAVEQLWGTLFAPKVIKADAVYYNDTVMTYA